MFYNCNIFSTVFNKDKHHLINFHKDKHQQTSVAHTWKRMRKERSNTHQNVNCQSYP